MRMRAIDGPIHILLNSAGIGGLGPIATAAGPGDMAAMTKVIEVNLRRRDDVTAQFAHRMIGNEPRAQTASAGVIVNACSIASFGGQDGMSAYTAAKAALAALTLVWCRDLSSMRIRVMGIAPGFMTTPMVGGVPRAAGRRAAQGRASSPSARAGRRSSRGWRCSSSRTRCSTAT